VDRISILHPQPGKRFWVTFIILRQGSHNIPKEIYQRNVLRDQIMSIYENWVTLKTCRPDASVRRKNSVNSVRKTEGEWTFFFIRRNFHKTSHALPNHTSGQCQLFIYFNLLMDMPFLICTSVIGEHNISFSINSCGESTKKRARTNLRSIPSQAFDRRSVQKQQMKRNKSLLLPINKTS
jgi:hypothetical protein